MRWLYYYRITYVTATGETESGAVSGAVTLSSTYQVDLSSIPTSPDTAVTARKIYRTPLNAAWPYNTQLVATINDNTTTTYRDNVSNASLGVNAPTINTTGGIIFNGTNKTAIFDNATTAIGVNALRTNSGYFNSAVGIQALYSNTNGYYNSGMGVQSLYSNTTGYFNSAMGVQAIYSNTTGYSNSAIGYQALYTNSTGYQNVAMGMNSLYSNNSGYSNAAVGFQAAYSNTTGYQNVNIGMNAGRYYTNGSTALAGANNSIYIGYNAMGLSNSDTNSIVIGASALGIGANSVVLGNDSITDTALKGNIGIGTTTPLALLDVNGIGAHGLGAVATPSFAFRTDLNTGMWSSGVDTINFSTNGTERLRMDNTGNIGIGTTGPGYKLHVHSTAAANNTIVAFHSDIASGGMYNEIRFSALGDTSPAAMRYLLGTNSNSSELAFLQQPDIGSGLIERMRINMVGNVGIGTTSPSTNLDVNGNARFRSIGSGAYTGAVNRMADGTLTTATSDVRLKQDIATIGNPLDKVMALRGVTFNWKDTDNPKRMMGMIAQEVMGVAPELVFQNPDGYYGINYGETSGLLIEAVKAQQGQISGQEVQITNIADNQNKITEQLTGQLADQNLTVDNKIQLIGASLDELTTKQIKTLKEQLAVQTQDLVALQKQMTDIQVQNTEFNEFLIAFDLKNIDNFAKKNAPLNIFSGKLEAEGIVAGAFSVKVVDETKKTLGEAVICETGKTFKDGDCNTPSDGDTISDGKVIDVMTKAVSSTAKIFITPQGDAGGRIWVEKQFDDAKDSYTGFKIKCSDAVGSSLKINWWIVEEE